MTVDPTNPAPERCLTCRWYVPGDRPRCGRASIGWFLTECKWREERSDL